jgi:hypothetical protein
MRAFQSSMDSGLGCFMGIGLYGGGLTSYYTYQHKSADHARTGFEGLSGVSEIFRFPGFGLLFG